MSITGKNQPPFATLLALEAVARLGSFTAAAVELRVSQAAISQKVRQLEDWTGTELVVRSRPVVRMTDRGLRLAEGIRVAIVSLDQTLAEARKPPSNPNHVTLAATNAFALYWLGPRIQEFYADHPKVEFTLSTTDIEVTEGQFEFDLGVTFAAGPPAGYSHRLLFASDVVAIASPDYLANRPPDVEPAQWRDDTMLHLAPHQGIGWAQWLDETDLPYAGGRLSQHHSTFITLIQAVLAGRGIALGWNRLVDPLLASGEVVRVGRRSTRAKGAYYLISRTPFEAPAPQGMRSLRDWLLGHRVDDPLKEKGRDDAPLIQS